MNPTWLYVGALYALAVWLVRRSGVALPRRVAFFFYLLVLVFLWRPMTQSFVDLPVDCVTRIPPWSFVERRAPVNCEMNDIVTQTIPWANEVRQSWKSLRVPLWSPYAGSGSVLLANAQSAALSPLRLLALPLSLGQSLTAEAAMKILIGLTGMFLFCRRRGYSDLASAAGAVAFGFCTFLVVWLHFAHSTVAAYLPAVLLQVDLLAERVTPARFAFAVALWAAIVFGGHPETALHIFLFALAMVIWMILVEQRRSLRFIGRLAGVMIVAGLVAAPLLAPFVEALTRSERYSIVRATPPGVAFTDLPSAILLVQPAFFGLRPLEPAWGPVSAESLSGFAGVLGIAGWVALLVETIATRRWRTREAFFIIATPVVLAIILNWPVLGPGFHEVFSFAVNSRLRLLFALLIAAQTAAAIDLIERGRRWPVLAGVASVAVLLVVVLAVFDFPSSALRGMLTSAIVLALGATATIPRARSGATLLLLAAVVAEVWWTGIRWNPVIDERGIYPQTPLIRTLKSFRERQSFRIAGLGAVLYPNAAAMEGLQDIRSHDPMANSRYLGVLRVVSAYDTDSYFSSWTNTDTALLNYLNVKYVVTDPGVDLSDRERYELVYDGRDGRIFRNRDVLPRFFAVRNILFEPREFAYAQQLATMTGFENTAIAGRLPVVNDRMRRDLLAPRPADSAEAKVVLTGAAATEFRMHVRAPRYSLVVSSQPFWPGWHVERNGQSLQPLLVNGAFLGFTVPPGDSDVRVSYFPWTFYGGVAIALFTVIAGISIVVWQQRR